MSGSMVPPGSGLDFRDYPRLTFTAPYFTQNPLGEMFAPAVREAASIVIPEIIAPYVQAASDNAVQNLAVMKAGDTMLGRLFSAHAMPAADSEYVTKAYVDMQVASSVDGVREVSYFPQNALWLRQYGQWVQYTAVDASNFLLLAGGTMHGSIDMGAYSVDNLAPLPVMPNGAAPASWVLTQLASISLYQGLYDANANSPDLTSASLQQNGWTWIAVTDPTDVPVVVSAAIPGLVNQTLNNGDTVVWSSEVTEFQIIHGGGLTMAEANALFLPLSGGTMAGPLMLARDPQGGMEAATRQWVASQIQDFPDVPDDGLAYARTYGAWVSVDDLPIWNAYLPLSGGTLTGTLSLAANASLAMQAVPLQQLTAAVPQAATATPLMDGTAAAGAGTTWARSDHVHPSDTSRLPLAGGTLTGALMLARDATLPLEAVTLEQMEAALAGGTDEPALNNVGRNLIHNPLFNIAQRGAGPFTVPGYTLDRWVVGLGAGDTLSAVQGMLSDANRADIGDEAAISGLSIQLTGASNAGSYVYCFQPIENVRRLAGKSVTVSFWANSGTANFRVGISFDQIFGTGGSPSADVNGTGQTATLSATAAQFARYSLTFTLPSIAGKTLGTNANSFTRLAIWLSAGSLFAARAGNIGVQSGIVNFWGMQLEVGSAATPLEKLDPQQDLARCQRFYFQNLSTMTTGFNAWGASGWTMTILALPVTMRAVPTVSLGGLVGTPANINNDGIATVSGTSIEWQVTSQQAGATTISRAGFIASADL